jgi:hypothetical protein
VSYANGASLSVYAPLFDGYNENDFYNPYDFGTNIFSTPVGTTLDSDMGFHYDYDGLE